MDVWVIGTVNQTSGKTSFSATGQFCTSSSTLVFHRAVLYGDVAFSILALSARKRYASFLKKVLLSSKTCVKKASVIFCQFGESPCLYICTLNWIIKCFLNDIFSCGHVIAVSLLFVAVFLFSMASLNKRTPNNVLKLADTNLNSFRLFTFYNSDSITNSAIFFVNLAVPLIIAKLTFANFGMNSFSHNLIYFISELIFVNFVVIFSHKRIFLIISSLFL